MNVYAPDGKETKAIVQQTGREATAIMQLLANNVDEVKRAQSHPYYSSMLKCLYRKAVAAGPPQVALVSQSIHKSHYLVRCSAQGNSKVVLPRQSF